LPLDLAKRLLARDRDAVALSLNLADDRRDGPRAEALLLLDALERDTPFPGPPRVGVTGAPGAGKSTLLDALVRTLRRRGETVAIAAVDPSSRATGGALLGDRIRISRSSDPGVFVRSLASRERLGGISDAARASVAIFAAAFDHVFVETVGVGQSESEVAGLVDTLVFVANPATGDELQFMKAGLIELPDVFCVNKADLGAPARRTASELSSALALPERAHGSWVPPVLLVSARDGTGIEELLDAIAAHCAQALASGSLRERRREGAVQHVLAALAQRFGSYGLERIGSAAEVRRRMAAEPGVSSFRWAELLASEVVDALRKPE
jgi:LAO/AO transport system kinase